MKDHECIMTGKIERILTQLDLQNEYQQKNLEAIQTLLHKHDEAINGNGKIGIKTRVKLLENYIAIIWTGFATGIGSLTWLGWESLKK